MKWYFVEVREGTTVRTVPLPRRGTLTLGRGGDCELQLLSPLVSSRHAQIEVTAAGPRLRDLGSKNGTKVNGLRIEASRTITPEDEVAIGPFLLQVREEAIPEQTGVTLLDSPEGAQRVFATIETSSPLEAAKAAALKARKAAGRNLFVLQRMGTLLLEAKEEADLIQGILDLVFEVFPAERAMVILRGPDGEPDHAGARARTRSGEALAVPRTIVKQVLTQGNALLTADAAVDERFRSGQSVILQGVRAVMCAPLRGGPDALGVVYTDSRMQRDAFRKEDLEILTSIGVQGGIAMENLRLLRKSLANERLAAVGAVIAGLSHDIRNILTTLRGGAYVLDRMLKESEAPEVREAWGIVRQGADTITALVDDMVSYSKERRPDRKPADLNALAKRVCDRFRHSGRGGAAVTLDADLAPDLPPVPFEATGIDRVLTNLLANAFDALEGRGGRVRVRTEAGPGPEEVSLVVSDDGPGVPPEHRDRIFDLLFSTKGSKGTGFGLAIVRKIAGEHGGRVDLDADAGPGATFRVVLPRA